MSEKCLHCETPIEQTPGKRERKFCKPSCCTLYHLKEKNKDKVKGKRGRKPGTKNKSKEETPPVNEIGSGTTGLVFKKPLSKKAKKKIKELQKGTTVIPITPTTESYYDGNKINRDMGDELILPPSKPQMPKGLSLIQQLEWREKNLTK